MCLTWSKVENSRWPRIFEICYTILQRWLDNKIYTSNKPIVGLTFSLKLVLTTIA